MALPLAVCSTDVGAGAQPPTAVSNSLSARGSGIRGARQAKCPGRTRRFNTLFSARRRSQRSRLTLYYAKPVHHCKPVKAWLAQHKEQMEVFYLPSYSPELNPEERLNADLKHRIRSKVPVRTQAKLHAAAVDHMTALANKPERVKTFFQDPFVKYAA